MSQNRFTGSSLMTTISYSNFATIHQNHDTFPYSPFQFKGTQPVAWFSPNSVLIPPSSNPAPADHSQRASATSKPGVHISRWGPSPRACRVNSATCVLEWNVAPSWISESSPGILSSGLRLILAISCCLLDLRSGT